MINQSPKNACIVFTNKLESFDAYFGVCTSTGKFNDEEEDEKENLLNF